MLREEIKNYQSQLADYCRTGVYTPLPGVKEQHVHHYRRLVYNIIDDSLESSFPLMVNLILPKEWKKLVHEFFENHKCEHYQVWQMPRELIVYLHETNHDLLKRYPCLENLMQFEWVECELYMMADIPCKYAVDETLNWEKPLVLNPEMILELVHYPVHLKNAKYISLTDKGSYFYAGHRHPITGKVIFTNVSPALVRIIENLSIAPRLFVDVAEEVCNELQIEFNAEAEKGLKAFIEKAFESQLILGTQV